MERQRTPKNGYQLALGEVIHRFHARGGRRATQAHPLRSVRAAADGVGAEIPVGGVPAGTGGLAPTLFARWQSALPVKQAFVRLKFGAQAATSPEAKQLLEREEPDYVIVVSGPLRSLLRGDSEASEEGHHGCQFAVR